MLKMNETIKNGNKRGVGEKVGHLHLQKHSPH